MGQEDKKGKKFNSAHPYPIICEGRDGMAFIIHCLNALIRNQRIPDNRFEAIDFGGNEDIRETLKILPLLAGYSSMKSILVVRDAEQSATQAVVSLQESFRNAFDVEVPSDGSFVMNADGIRVGFYLFPGWKDGHFQDGTLEDLCDNILRDVKGEAGASYLQVSADKYLAHVLEQKGSFRRRHKNRLHTILSGTDRFVGLKIGEAAKVGAFDFEAEEMKELNERICEMMQP